MRRRLPVFGELFLDITAVAPGTLWWIPATTSGDPVDDTKIFEDFLGARLNTLAARARKWAVILLDQTKADAAPRQTDRQGQPSGAGATNQDIRREILCHDRLHMCIMHTYEGPPMRSGKKVQNTHISAQLRLLHMSMLEIFAVMNLPRRDEVLIREAGIPLDRALFPLLVHIERFGPIGVVDLACRVGRDYTTVSRQVAKLESLGLVSRQPGARDRRVREAVITP